MRRRHVAELPLAISFVADTPVDHTIGSRMSVLGTQESHRGIHGTVDILHPLCSGVGVSESGVDDEIRLTAQQSAPGQIFVCAHIVGLDGVPGIVVARGTLVRIADTVAPLVA